MLRKILFAYGLNYLFRRFTRGPGSRRLLGAGRRW